MNIKAIVQQYFDAFIKGEFKKAAQYKSPDEKHWISGEGSWPFGGWQTAESMVLIHARIRERFPQGLQISINAIISEGDSAAVHIRNYAERIDGRIYDNQIVFLMRIQHGLIVEEKEFLDTIMVNVNVLYYVRMIHRLLPAIKTLGWGRMIQVGSSGGIELFALQPDYLAATAAPHNLTVRLRAN